MAAYIARRVLWTIPVLFAIATVTFALMHLVEGGPWDRPGKPLPPGVEARLNREYGLDKPLWEQYATYMLNLGRGDLGVSLRHNNRPVRDMLGDGIRISGTLGLLSLALSLSAGVTLGVASALRRNSAVDYAAVAIATAGASVPSFVVGMLLLVLFTANLHWFPSTGWGTPKQAVLPVLALSALPAAYIARVTRASMLDVLTQDYARTARAKGLRERTILLRHLLRNALIPILTVAGPLAAALVTGSFIIEKKFGIPGIGFAYVNAIDERDYGLIMGTTLFYATVVVVANLVVDLLYSVVDPRIRYGTHG